MRSERGNAPLAFARWSGRREHDGHRAVELAGHRVGPQTRRCRVHLLGHHHFADRRDRAFAAGLAARRGANPTPNAPLERRELDPLLMVLVRDVSSDGAITLPRHVDSHSTLLWFPPWRLGSADVVLERSAGVD